MSNGMRSRLSHAWHLIWCYSSLVWEPGSLQSLFRLFADCSRKNIQTKQFNWQLRSRHGLVSEIVFICLYKFKCNYLFKLNWRWSSFPNGTIGQFNIWMDHRADWSQALHVYCSDSANHCLDYIVLCPDNYTSFCSRSAARLSSWPLGGTHLHVLWRSYVRYLKY